MPRAMAAQLGQPIGIKKLTNIAVVRLKKHGVRFEIACYKNTVVAWRDKFEKDIDNVLQTTQIYANVSKGVLAKEEDLLKAFGTTDETVVSRLILDSGELQVSDKERKSNFDAIFRDAVTVLVDKCVNPETNRPYPPGMIERALKDIHFSVDPMKSAKQQALAAIPKLQTVFPIQRAAMRFKFTVPAAHVAALLEALENVSATIESKTAATAGSGDACEVTCTADPSAYRACDRFIRESTGGQGRLEVVTMAVMEGGTSADRFHVDGGHGGGSADPAGTDRQTGNRGSAASGVIDLGRGREEVETSGAFAMNGVAGALGVAGTLGGGDGEGVRGAGGAAISAGAAESRTRGTGVVRPRRDASAADVSVVSEGTVVLYRRGAIAGMPEEYASRRDRFAALDEIQEGWKVELRQKPGSSVVDAVFFCPMGIAYKAFAEARREALKASKG